ncbi:TetR/AcrR family transcriptional regulator [Bradyrhizobium diazoefficiens]|nr:TetR/AcrR family transcriptional regulator [Bradyrhizobium diazoefficiens]QQN62235.1 TetR/AcrR family transcriptional regulator [Bradyrhizobium diazoefficiens]
MARPREFDEAAVLDVAIQRFWLSGYEATSVRELADEMGIAGASLYNAFGDKRTLYRSALNRYLEQTFRERIRRLESTVGPAEAIRAFFGEIIDRSVTDKRKRGCLLVNSTLENVHEDRDFHQIVNTFLSEVEGFFLRSVAAGQRAGTVTTSQAKEDLARMLLGELLGIRVFARIDPSRTVLEGMIRPVFALLFEFRDQGPKRRPALRGYTQDRKVPRSG